MCGLTFAFVSRSALQADASPKMVNRFPIVRTNLCFRVVCWRQRSVVVRNEDVPRGEDLEQRAERVLDAGGGIVAGDDDHGLFDDGVL
jgi:hypothetical protein